MIYQFNNSARIVLLFFIVRKGPLFRLVWHPSCYRVHVLQAIGLHLFFAFWGSLLEELHTIGKLFTTRHPETVFQKT